MYMACQEHVKHRVNLTFAGRHDRCTPAWEPGRAGLRAPTCCSNRTSFLQCPKSGKSESYYANFARQADADGNIYAHEAAKVGQYITLALDRTLDWPAKLRYFEHALEAALCSPAGPG